MVADDVVDGEADDAARGLGEQQDKAGGGAGARRRLVAGERPAQQVQAALLGDGRARGGRPDRGQGDPGQVAGFDGPGQEGADRRLVTWAAGDVPGVDAGPGKSRRVPQAGQFP